jgi:DNA-binding MarR family transcriptional regulator
LNHQVILITIDIAMGTARAAATAQSPKVPWLRKSEEPAWRALAMLVNQLRRALDTQLERDAGLSAMEFYTLVRLSEEPDCTLRMSELALVTEASLSRLSHMVKRLEAWGFVRRQPDPTDGRYTTASLTEAGCTKLVASAPAHVKAVRALVIDEFNSTELAQLRDLASRILRRIENSEWRLDLT